MSHDRSTAHELLDDLEMIEQLLSDKAISDRVKPDESIPDDNIPVLDDIAEDVPEAFQAVIHPSVNTPLVVLPGVKIARPEVSQTNPVKPQSSPFMLADSLEEQLKVEGEKMIQGVIDDWLPKLESSLRKHLNQALDQYVGERVANWSHVSGPHVEK